MWHCSAKLNGLSVALFIFWYQYRYQYEFPYQYRYQYWYQLWYGFLSALILLLKANWNRQTDRRMDKPEYWEDVPPKIHNFYPKDYQDINLFMSRNIQRTKLRISNLISQKYQNNK